MFVASLVTVTVAPATDARFSSTTRPRIREVLVWAKPVAAAIVKINKAAKILGFLMRSSWRKNGGGTPVAKLGDEFRCLVSRVLRGVLTSTVSRNHYDEWLKYSPNFDRVQPFSD